MKNLKAALAEKMLKDAGLHGKLLEQFVERHSFAAADDDEPKSQGKKPKEMAKNEVSIFGLICLDELADVYAWFFGEENITTPSMVRKALAECDGDVTLRIDSGGGFIKAADPINVEINKYDKGKVNALVTGWAASAATVIAVQADNIEISEFAEFMIHRASIAGFGNANRFEEVAADLAKTDDVMANAYARKSGKKPEEMLTYMDKETWFSAQQAIDVGLCDSMVARRNEKDDKDEKPSEAKKDKKTSNTAIDEAVKANMTYLSHLDLV